MKLTKKFFSILVVMLSFVLIFGVNADGNVAVDTGGWRKIGENQVQVYSLNLRDAHIVFSDSNLFKLTRTANYSDSDYAAGGKFVTEKDTAVSYNDTDGGSNVIVYTGALSVGTHENLGNMTLTWEESAWLQDTTPLDVVMHVDNISVKAYTASTKPIQLFSNSGTNQETLWMNARYAKQDFVDDVLGREDHKTSHDELGVKYNISFEFFKAGTNQTEKITGKNVVLNYSDLDMPENRQPGHAEDVYLIDANTPAEYAEGIKLLSGLVEDKVYVDSNHVLKISENNTRFTGTKSTGPNDDVDSDKAGFSVMVKSEGFSYQWTGSGCGTAMGFMPVKKVVTSTSGKYPHNVKITPTDEEVLWKEDKVIEITPDSGYKLSKVTVDGREISISSLTHTSGKYYYTFEDVIEDHRIDVQVDKDSTIIIDVPPTFAGISTVLLVVGIFAIVGSIAIICTLVSSKRMKE